MTSAPDEQAWRTDPAAYETIVNADTPTAGEYHVLGLCRDIVAHLAARAGTEPAPATYREAAWSTARSRFWQTITTEVNGHHIRFAAVADPHAPAALAWSVDVDDQPVTLRMTYARPLAVVLADAAWTAIQRPATGPRSH